MNLYISEPKTHISISGQTLVITTESEVKKFPLGLLKSICLHKNVQITSQAICRLCEEGISIAWISSDRIVCQTFGTGNVLRQKQQFDILHNDKFILNLSKRNIHAKIRNQMYLIHRPELFQETDITKCNTIQSLLGIEGSYASIYFAELSKLFPMNYHFIGRKKHPATDPVNSALSFSYTLLYHHINRIISVHGLNPSVGFCHTLHNGHYALSSDLMESLRCELCDSIVLKLFSVLPDMKEFTETATGILLSKEFKQNLIRLFQEELDAEYSTGNGFSNSKGGAAEQLVCSYLNAIEQENAELFTPFERK